MPAPSTSEEFFDLIRKSALLDEKSLDEYVQKVCSTPSAPTDPSTWADALVRDGILTNFQIEQFLQGRWKGFTLGKFRILERIGSGGMANVYLCEHRVAGSLVAVKVLSTKHAEDPTNLKRFHREARCSASLDHPNIVRFIDVDQDDVFHYLVMEYVDGASLQSIVDRFGYLDICRACHYIRQAAEGLQHAHEAGVVHRDIKPGNVLIDRQGRVRLLDLGLARFLEDEEVLTRGVIGTADYLAPEQTLDSHQVDIRADIYSLGGTFYFILTGKQPFPNGTVAQKLIWHLTRQPKPIRLHRPEVPEELQAIVQRMMAKEPSRRPQTPREVVEELEAWTREPIAPPPEAEMPRVSPAVQKRVQRA